MDSATVALAGATVLNAAFAIGWTLWRPRHHRALASMLGVERRGRPPLLPWKRILKRLKLLGNAAGAGVFALREIIFAVVAAIAATALSFFATTQAIAFAQQHDQVTVLLGGVRADTVPQIGEALLSHIASVRLQDGFELTGLPASELHGNRWIAALTFSLLAVFAGVGLKALSEWFKCIWYALVCIAFPRSAEDALEESGGGIVRVMLGLPRPSSY